MISYCTDYVPLGLCDCGMLRGGMGSTSIPVFSLFRGSFARVKLAIRRSDSHPFAVKIIRKKHLSQEAMKVVYDEITILQKVRGFASVHVFAL